MRHRSYHTAPSLQRDYNSVIVSFIMNSDIQNKNCTFITLLDLRELHCTLPFIPDFTCLPIHSPHCCNTYLTHCERCFTYSLCLYVLKWYWSFHPTMYFYICCCVQTILLFARPHNFPSQNNPKLFAGIKKNATLREKEKSIWPFTAWRHNTSTNVKTLLLAVMFLAPDVKTIFVSPGDVAVWSLTSY